MSFPTLVLIAVVFFIPTAWAIIHIAYRDFGTFKKKGLWGLLVVFLPPLGGIIYFAVYKFQQFRKKA